MRLKFLFTLITVLSLLSVRADTVEITGQVTILDGMMPQSIYVTPYDKVGAESIATISSSTFTIKVPVARPAQYTLFLMYAPYDIILSPADKKVKLAISISSGQIRNIKVDNAPENDAYKAMNTQVKSYDEKLRTLLVDCDKEEACGKELHTLLISYKSELDNISTKYKGTYTADVLCRMETPDIATDVGRTAAELRAGYFRNVAFADQAILSTPVYKEMIDAYADFLIDPTYRGQEAFIKTLMTNAQANPTVLRRTAEHLYEALVKKSREKMLGMFIRWYKENKEAINNRALDTKIDAMSHVMPGQPYIDISRADVTGAQRSLKEIVSTSVCTLVMFWSPGCSHCTEEMPYIKEMYEKYHAKGLSIYGYCIDRDDELWRPYLTDKQLTWTNVINGDTEWKPMIDYVVETTPTLVLIDRKGTILHRFVPKSKMDKYIEEALNK